MKLFNYRYLPLNIYILYSFIVAFALIFGPIKFLGMNYALVGIYLTIFLCLFAVAFIAGSSGDLYIQKIGNDVLFVEHSIFKFLLYFCLVISVKSWLVFFFSGNSLSLSSMGSNYVSSYDGYIRGGGSIGITYIVNIFEQTFTTITLLLIFSFFGNIKGRAKYISVFIITTYLLVNVIGSGKQKYFGDLIIFSLYSYQIFNAIQGIRFNLKKIMVYMCVGVAIILCFSFILSLRYTAIGISGDNISTSLHPLAYWDDNSIVLFLFGNKIGFSIGMFLAYLSNGLYGLNLCLHLPFEWTYFLGSSYSLAKIIEITLGEPGLILSHSYVFRSESLGWGLDKWHSIFSWLASDFTFPGVLLIGAMFGFIYGRLWIKAIEGSNPIAKPLFIYLSLGLIFSYSNNQLVHSLSGVFVLVGLCVLYLLTSKNSA